MANRYGGYSLESFLGLTPRLVQHLSLAAQKGKYNDLRAYAAINGHKLEEYQDPIRKSKTFLKQQEKNISDFIEALENG